jgi:GDP/UDP-N,N'-diacetylbacillosamine 2-epimerase (hydrolysing)
MNTVPRKVIYLSGTRADFGLMASTLRHIAARVDLGVAVTGMHLDGAFGGTEGDIVASGLPICGSVPMDLAARDAAGMSRALGQCIVGLTDLLDAQKPDVLMLLGDRGEMLAGAIAALHLGIVTIHIHGGERSGTVDEPMRHAISKLCSYHFTATQEAADRLVRMGEQQRHVYVTGAPGLDDLQSAGALSDVACRQALGLPPSGAFVLALFHPVVQQAGDAYAQTCALAGALSQLGLPVVWLDPNADAGSAEVLRALQETPLPAGSIRLRHLPRAVFCAAMRHCAVMAGNSSAGIIEAASFGTPVVNIGDRQKLRERNSNVTDVPAQGEAISGALSAAISHGRWPCINRYGDGLAGKRIAELVATLELPRSLLEKSNTY